jgi:competence protein ComEC
LNGIFASAQPFSFRLVLAVTAGIAAAQQFASLPSPFAIILLTGAALLLWAFRLRIPAACLFGMAWALALATPRWQDELPSALEGRDVQIEGQIVDVPDTIDRGLRFGFHIETVLNPPAAPLPADVRLSWYDSTQTPKAGQRWRLRVRLKKPHSFFNPGGMDYELWLFSQGIRAVGYVRDDDANQKLAEAPAFSLPAWRQAAFDRLNQALRQPPADNNPGLAGLIIALTLGEESAISQAQWQVLRRTGTAHLVAISGSHISLIAGLVFWLAQRSCARIGLMRWPPQTLAAILSFTAAWAYSALANFAIPTQRALVMIAVVMLGIAVRRNLRPAHTLSLALLAVILYDPLAVLSVGFWLSFGAVALILLVVAGRLQPPGWGVELLKSSWAIFLGLTPLTLLFFQQASLVSLPANLLAVPVIGTLLTPLCLVGALLMAIYPPGGTFILHLAETLLGYCWLLLQWLSDLPMAQLNHPAPPLWSLPFALIGILLLLAPRGIPARWLGIVFILPAALAKPDAPDAEHFRLTLLDVGQGLAAVVQTHSHTLVFDTGGRFSSRFDAGAAVVEPYLRQQGTATIDALIVSHGDSDHIGGAASLLQSFSIGQILTSVPAQFPAKTAAQSCHAGQSWEWDGVRFDMLAPIATLEKENDNSCVLRVSSPTGSALLTGDIEREAERQLVELYGMQLQSTVLVAPHHGSNTSSSAAFLAQVRPRYVLLPLGYLNRFNFPHPDVLRRYQAINAEIFDSASAGAISLEPGDTPPTSYRASHSHYWNAR